MKKKRKQKKDENNETKRTQGTEEEEEDLKGPVDDKLYMCNFCQQPYSRDYMAISHIRHKHWSPTQHPSESFTTLDLGKMVMKVKSRKARTYGMFTCTLCNSTMDRMAMAAHVCVTDSGSLSCVTAAPDGKTVISDERIMYLFTKRQGFLCDTCGEVFKIQSQLDTHLFKVHGQTTDRNRGCVCGYCGRAFSYVSLLRNHSLVCKERRDQEGESGERWWVCDACGKKFKHKANMMAHKRDHHLAGKKFQCQHCPKQFYKLQHWLTHTRQHFGASQFVCHLCNQQFLRNYNLKVHLRIHSGEKPYKCRHCGAAFSQQTSLTYHLRKHDQANCAVGRGHTASESEAGPGRTAAPQCASGSELISSASKKHRS